MADEHGEGGGNPWGELVFLSVILFIIILFWFVSGRPNAGSLSSLLVRSPLAASSSPGGNASTTPINWLPFWNPSAPQGQGGETGAGYQYTGYQFKSTTGAASGAPQLAGYLPSPQSGQVIIQDYSGARSSVPEGEYIVVSASSANSGPVDITGWQVRSAASGSGEYIGVGTDKPVLGQSGTTGDILLNPGDTAVITSGRSPLGTSFRENACIGYLAQYQYFTPPFVQGCPAPQNELNIYTDPQDAQDSRCVQAVAALSSCSAVITAPPGVGSSCSDFMVRRFSYNGCTAAHQSDPNFKGTRWRIYLGDSRELWNNQSDIIVLLDTSGRLVTAVTY